MPVKLRTPKTKRSLVTPAAVEAFRAGDSDALYQALGLKPWEWSPLEAVGEPPAYLARNEWQLRLYREAQELRRELEAMSCQ